MGMGLPLGEIPPTGDKNRHEKRMIFFGREKKVGPGESNCGPLLNVCLNLRP